MQEKPSLLVAPCDYQAAKYAVTHWHYSRSMPAFKPVTFGAWDNGIFVGAIIFGYGANQHLPKAFGLLQTECVELCRVAFSGKQSVQTSYYLGKALKLLKQMQQGLRLVISYADIDQDHLGILYQATNWAYLGCTELNGGTHKYIIHGRICHKRQVHLLYGKGTDNLSWIQTNIDPSASIFFTKGKHKYAYPLDKAMKKQLAPLCQPYPKKDLSNDTPNETKP